MARNTRHIDFANARALLLRGHVLQESKTERGSDFVIPGGGPVTQIVARRLRADRNCVAVDEGLFAGIPQTWTLAKCRR